VDITRFAATCTRSQLRDRVHALEQAGATGITVSDHVFGTLDGRPRTEITESMSKASLDHGPCTVVVEHTLDVCRHSDVKSVEAATSITELGRVQI